MRQGSVPVSIIVLRAIRDIIRCFIETRTPAMVYLPQTTVASAIVTVDQRGPSSGGDDQPTTSTDHPSSGTCNRQVFPASLSQTVLLGTAMVNIVHQGIVYPAIALIDSGPLVTERLHRQLRLVTSHAKARVSGVNMTVSANVRKLCTLCIGSPLDSELRLETGAFVLANISGHLPSFRVSPNFGSLLPAIKLADARFYDCRPVDVLLVADLYPRLISGESQRVADSLPAQDTVFGWIIIGPIPAAHARALSTTVNFMEEELNKTLLRFWELEETPRRRILSPADMYCEELYKRTTYRDSEGRYVVSLPLISGEKSGELGESRPNVLAQFYRNESSLMRKPTTWLRVT